MTRFKRMVEGDGGWCDWQAPLHKGYKMACCDCGLVHDMEFRVVKAGRNRASGVFTYREIVRKDGRFRVMMRARRNNRSTAAMRRAKGKARP